MNILRIIYDWPDENNITAGLAPAPYELSVSQTKLGHKIFVLCGNLNGKNIKKLRFSYSLEGGKIVVYNLPRGLKHFGPFITTSLFVPPYYFYLRFFKNIEIVHNHQHLGLYFLLYKRLFGFLDKIPVVGQIHITAKGREDMFTSKGDSVPFFTKNIEHRLHKFSDFLSTKVCKNIVTVSLDVKEELIKYYKVSSKKIFVVESGVNTDRYKKEGKSVETGFSKTDIVLGNLGFLSRRKRIHFILQALTVLPENYKLALWGKWDKEYQKELSKIIKKSNLKERVQYFGEIPYFESDKAYRSMDIFLLPSSYEGLPKVVLEALSCGNKVIASGFKTSISLDNLYLQEIQSVNEFVGLIKKVTKATNNYTSTRKLLVKNYSWDAKAKEIEIIYNSIK